MKRKDNTRLRYAKNEESLFYLKARRSRKDDSDDEKASGKENETEIEANQADRSLQQKKKDLRFSKDSGFSSLRKKPKENDKNDAKEPDDKNKNFDDAELFSDSKEYIKARTFNRTTPLQDVLQLLLKILIILFAFVLVFTAFLGVFRASDDQMRLSVKEGDLVIYYRLEKEFVAKELVVLDYEGELQTRRVVAIAGDTVDIDSTGKLRVNGNRQAESEVRGQTLPYEEGITFPVTLGENEIFVMADFREDSVDSRVYGPVSLDDVLGKPIMIIRNRNL